MPRIITKIERSGPRTPGVRQPNSSLVVQQGVMFQSQRAYWKFKHLRNNNKKNVICWQNFDLKLLV